MSNLSLTRLTASGSPTGLVRLRCWVEQQNAEYNREYGGVDDGPFRLGDDNLLGFEQRYGGFPHDVVAGLENLFPDLAFSGYVCSEFGWFCHIEIRHGYTRVRFEDEDDWEDCLGRADYLIDADDDIDTCPSKAVVCSAQAVPADFIEWMMRDDTAAMVPKERETPPGWPFEADPDLSSLDDIALIWELKRRGRAVISLGPNQVNQVYARLTERSPWDSAPLPPVVDALLVDPLIAERVQHRMGRAGVDEIAAILDERPSGRGPDVSQPVFDDGHQEREALLMELKATLVRLTARSGE